MRRGLILFAVVAATGCGSPDEAAWSDGVDATFDQSIWQRADGVYASIPYVELVPRTRGLDAPLPIVVWLHGITSRPDVPSSTFYGLGDVRLVLPHGPMVAGAGFSWFDLGWTLSARPMPDRTQLAQRAGELAGFLEQLARVRGVVGRPVVSGFSQGGILSLGLAVLRPHAAGAIFPCAGWLPADLIPERTTEPLLPRIRAMHGGADTVISADAGQETLDLLTKAGYDAQLLTYEGVGHTMSDPMQQQLGDWLGATIAALGSY